MRLEDYLEISKLPVAEQNLLKYVRARIGWTSADQLGLFLLKKIETFRETIKGEKNSIMVWAKEFGTEVRF